VIGLACAWELARRDVDVVLLEARHVGAGVSRGNAGWICPTLIAPLAGPGMVREGLHQLLGGGGAFVLRPRLDPTLLRWLVLFARNSTRRRYDDGFGVLTELSRGTVELFEEYVAAGVGFELHRDGLVIAALTEEGLEPYRRRARRLGHEVRELDGPGAAELDPALDGSAIAGALYSTLDRHVRPETLTAGLARSLLALGGEVREEWPVTAIVRRRGEWYVRSPNGDVAADDVVVAAGLGSAPLLYDHGVRTPLVGARGYSVDVARDADAPRHALYLVEAKLAVSPFADAVRVAGVLELGTKPQRRDLLEAARPYVAPWRPASPTEQWTGLRPATPSGLPILGRVKPGLYAAAGHAMLGVTLAPATARRLASWIA
jgi:D-amino-acid dehydrogenase